MPQISRVSDQNRQFWDAKLNTERVYHVVENARTMLLESTSLHNSGGSDFDRLEAVLTAAVTMLAGMHAAMTRGDEVVDLLPSVL